MFTRFPPVYKGILLALLGYSIFAGADTCAKYLTQYYSLYEVLCIEQGIGAGILLLLSRWLGGAGGLLRRDNLKVQAIRTGLNFAVCILVLYSLRALPMTMAYTLFFTIPFFAAVWVIPLYGEHITRNRLFAIMGGFTGVLIAMRPGAGFEPPMLVALAAAAVIALMFALGRSMREPTLFQLGFPPIAGVAVACLPLMLPGFTIPTFFHLLVFLISGSCAASGFILISVAFRAAAAAAVSPMMYIQMLWGSLFGFLIFGDKPDLWVLAGAAVIIISGIYLIKTEHKNA